MTIEPQPAGPTFARSARVNGTCTTYGRVYIYKKHLHVYIYIYDEDFSPLYDKCGARAARQLENATALGSLIRPRAVTRCNLAVSDMYMRDFGKTHQIAYTYCSVGISDLKPLTGTSADQLPHRKSRSLATA